MNEIRRLLIDNGATMREADVGELVCEGLKNSAIGERLFISVSCVKCHLTVLYEKLDVKSRLELAVFCLARIIKRREVEPTPIPSLPSANGKNCL